MKLRAYHLDPNGNFNEIPARDWDVILQDLIKLEELLRSDEPVEYANHPEWRRQATKTLPGATFVWWDKFESLHQKLFPYTYDEKQKKSVPRDQSFAINEHPRMEQEFAQRILEGFENQVAADANNLHEEALDSNAVESSLQKLKPFQLETKLKHEKLHRVVIEYRKNHPNKPDTWIAEKIYKDGKGLGYPKSTIYTYMKKYWNPKNSNND